MPAEDKWCGRKDGLNLIEKMIEEDSGEKRKYVDNRDQLMATDVSNVDFLLGLFNWDHMKFENQRSADCNGGKEDECEPSLTEMTEVAIKMLSKGKNGFFLMVEGGRIDHAHHEGRANTALDETASFDSAVEAAFRMTNPQETLIIVTADHGHTMSMGGYPKRGADIRGHSNPKPKQPDGKPASSNRDGDGQPISFLTYANGPGMKTSSLD